MYQSYDFVYVVLILLPTIILGALSSLLMRNSYSNWSRHYNSARLTGLAVGSWMQQAGGLKGVRFEASAESQADHYEPGRNVVRLSPEIANESSITSMAIVAHELGHAQQYAERSLLASLVLPIAPAATYSPSLAYFLIVAAFFAELTGLLWLGLIILGAALLIMLLTLPIEFDASRRGLAMLRQAGLLNGNNDEIGVRRVLISSSFTYLAASIAVLISVVRVVGQMLPYLMVLKRKH